MLPGLEMMACPNLAVPAEVMQHVVNVESSRNPYAIGVVGGQLVRQPENLGEAVATARMLEAKGYNYSLGVAQVNRANLGKFGLDTYEKAFDVCPNLVAGSQILAQCYASAGGDWGKAFSCYYSGNFTTGYQDGYVQKIFDSMARQGALVANAIPIPLVTKPMTTVKGTPVRPVDGSAYRVAMRSVADAALAAAMAPAVAKVAGVPPPSRAIVPGPNSAVADTLPDAASIAQALQAAQAAQNQVMPLVPGNGAIPLPGGTLPTPVPPATPGRIPIDPATAAVMSQIGVSSNPTGTGPADDNGVFEPQVQGPNDPAPSSVATPTAPTTPAGDPADLRRGGADGAFVF
ncbi:lytic transglycosylase domain-containing protein [Luteibacter yeojuensis]|uniref:Lytic transglycosylase domain-containing protein n=1 Tax=Luteibacter yeojuensis TaxID=345309 RepID=A0A7X5QRA2_9GAMM|nr:lytic transglycosylase domain-containing protein [Luteibacter yeojuensis]